MCAPWSNSWANTLSCALFKGDETVGELGEVARWIAIGLLGVGSVVFLPLWVIGLVSTVLEHRREMKQLGAGSETLLQQLQTLREEVAELRRTTTEHQLSLQANLENLQERVRALEAERERHQTIRPI
ncbi:MAG: hypothetical protein NZL85_05955 [Fimbriimonadales bacterium]|nr:hypothetical protein [Fimbriimonadales bacterium]